MKIMKKIFKKILVFALCMSMLGGTDVYACGTGMTSTLSTISDLAKRLTSVFVGSQNEKADIDSVLLVPISSLKKEDIDSVRNGKIKVIFMKK